MRAQLRPTRLGRLERPVFTAAMAAVAINLADVSGMPLSPYSVLVIAIPLAAALVHPGLRRGGRAALALVAGLLTFPFGVINAVFHVFIYGPAWEDATGILLAVAGLALLALGVGVIARRAGDQPPLSRRRQVRRGVAAAVAAPIVLFFVVMPVLMGMFITHPIRLAAPAAKLGLPHEDVSFKAADGVRLRGWYIPARNGVGVILMHGSGGNRSGTALHARMLARHGYGVLAFDQRGHGDSGGHGNLLGWNAYPDVEGAIAFLEHRAGIEHIAGFGLSMGAEVLLNATARDHRIEAVVSDGAEDVHAEIPASFQLIRAFGGVRQPTPLTQLVERIAPRPAYLISTTRRGVEDDHADEFARRIGPSAERWSLSDAGHTAGLRVHPREYERRAIGFLDRVLGAQPAS